MSKITELNGFLENMFTHNLEKARNADDSEYRKLRQEHIDEMLESNLTYDQQEFIEEILFELRLAADSDAQMLYIQGIKDCIWLLKQLQVLA